MFLLQCRTLYTIFESRIDSYILNVSYLISSFSSHLDKNIFLTCFEAFPIHNFPESKRPCLAIKEDLNTVALYILISEVTAKRRKGDRFLM